jgi:putative membrane protein insertion efficiency factor
MRTVLLFLIRVYRAAISPLLGPRCRFEPSCSAYAEEALRTHGVVRGLGLAIWRLGRCHPFARGGIDPVPRRLGSSGAHE